MDLVHNSFDAGELSPEMDGRSDLPRYHRGCRNAEGFVVIPTGGVTRRPGLRVANFSADLVSETGEYPTLQALTAAEIPTPPDPVPDDIPLVGAISVTDAAGLQAMVPGNHYRIENDIDLSGVTWTPLAWNSKTDEIVIEGNNHIISNLTLGPGAAKRGFIGKIGESAPLTLHSGGGQVRNLIFDNCSVTGGSDTAVFCGWFYPLSYSDHGMRWSFKNITIRNSAVITAGGADIGILFGEFATESSYISGCTAENCTITITASGLTQNVGGLIGHYNNTAYEGGTDDYSSIINSAVIGGSMALTGLSFLRIGGFIGTSNALTYDHYLYNCYSSMDISGTISANSGYFSAVGGFVGMPHELNMSSCYSTSSITITNEDKTSAYVGGVGGFAGTPQNHNNTVNCYCTGAIIMTGSAAWASINNCGGFTGYSQARDSWLRCYSTSSFTVTNDVTSVYCIGGFCGDVNLSDTDSSFDRCWAQGDITFSGTITTANPGTGDDAGHGAGFIGGFIGYWDYHASVGATVDDCYSWSSIVLSGSYPSDLTVAGFLGGIGSDLSNITFTNCYCAQTNTAAGSGLTGQIPATDDAHSFGSLGGASDIVVTACFYDTQTSSLSSSDIGVGHVTTWMQRRSNYEAAGWDFSTIWVLHDTSEATSLNSELSTATRLVGFVHKTDKYVLAFGDHVMYVFKGGTGAAAVTT